MTSKESSTTMTIRCLCGANKITTEAPTSTLPISTSHCHCDSCRHATGTLVFSAFHWPDRHPQVESLTKYAFSPKVNTYFCPTCGGLLFWHVHSNDPTQSDGQSHPFWAASGALDDPKGKLVYEHHIFVGDTRDDGCAGWLKNIDGREQIRWKEHVDGEKLPIGWREPVADGGEEVEDAVLRARCLCKGVDFYITRPTEQSADLSLGPPKDNKPWWLNPSKTRYTTGLCVCDSCRLSLGVALSACANVPLCNLYLTSPSNSSNPSTNNPSSTPSTSFPPPNPTPLPPTFTFGTITSYASSPGTTRYFCHTCGANVFYVTSDRRKLPDVAVGLLEARTGALAEGWLEWGTEGVNCRGDAERRGGLVGELERGLRAWGKGRKER